MKLHDLSPAKGSRRAPKRIGRGPGSGTGKTAGKGHKGQKSRSGYSRRLGFDGTTGTMSLDEAVAEWGEHAANYTMGANSRVRAKRARRERIHQ